MSTGFIVSGFGFKILNQHSTILGYYSEVFTSEDSQLKSVKGIPLGAGMDDKSILGRYSSDEVAQFVLRMIGEWDSTAPFIMPSNEEAERGLANENVRT